MSPRTREGQCRRLGPRHPESAAGSACLQGRRPRVREKGLPALLQCPRGQRASSWWEGLGRPLSREQVGRDHSEKPRRDFRASPSTRFNLKFQQRDIKTRFRQIIHYQDAHTFEMKNIKRHIFSRCGGQSAGCEPHPGAHAASPSSPPAPRPLNASAALTSLLVTGGIGKTASRLLCGLSPWGLGPQCFLRPALRRSCQPPPAGWGWGGTNTQEEADRQRPSLPRAALKRAAAASSAGQPCSLSSGTSAPTAPTHYGHMSGRAPAPRERLGLHLF